jgi:hypothetical protein
LYFIDISSVPEIKANPTLKNCLPCALQESDPNRMSIRTTRKIVKFSNPFTMEGVGRVLPAGNYEVVTDEELIEELSFPVYRRVATMMLAPTQTSHSIEMLTIDPSDLTAAMKRDALFGKGVSVSAKPP